MTRFIDRNKKLRYVEISRRNPVTRIRVGACSDVCMEIRRAGQEKCQPIVDFCPDNPCTCAGPKPMCDTFIAKVCALEVDMEGWATFEWPSNLMNITEGWYEGHLYTGCNCCGKVPVRVGPRCNVLEVETTIIGPDSKCWVGCEDECLDPVCPSKTVANQNDGRDVYIPDYRVYN